MDLLSKRIETCDDFSTSMVVCLLMDFHVLSSLYMLTAALLVWRQSAEFVYAYYVIRTISNIISQGSIFCIAVAYAVRFFLN